MFKHLARSFKNAFNGIVYVFRYELNFRIQVLIAIIVFIAAFYFPLRRSERMVVIMFIGLVLILELANSILERIIDLFKPRINYIAGSIKDILAGAVLIAAIMAVVVGIIIFLPYIKNLF